MRGKRGKGLQVNKDRIEGNLKEAEGKLTGDEAREKQGQAQDTWGKAKGKAEETWDSAKEKLDRDKDDEKAGV
jgi:uncharacterized protein YjbJ (UPF0337 family)